MDSIKEFLPLLTTIVAACTAVFGYLYQTNRTLKSKQLSERKAQYKIILFNVFKLLRQPQGLDDTNTLIETGKSSPSALDDVLDKCYFILDVHKIYLQILRGYQLTFCKQMIRLENNITRQDLLKFLNLQNDIFLAY